MFHDGVEITGATIIADKFNEYFTEIGSKLARSIDAANKKNFQFLSYSPLGGLIRIYDLYRDGCTDLSLLSFLPMWLLSVLISIVVFF